MLVYTINLVGQNHSFQLNIYEIDTSFLLNGLQVQLISISDANFSGETAYNL